MKVIVCENYAEMSERAALIVADQVKTLPSSVLGLATGSTPEGMYAYLAGMHKGEGLDFSEVKTVNLDEYYPISPENDQSYRYFMNYHLFDKVNIKKENTYVPDGTTDDPEGYGEKYESVIEELGGIDLQVLGIGRNAHIGFNEPGDVLYANTHVTDLTAGTIEANSRFFDSADEVPKRALTMGIGSILRARKIIVLASGKEKHDAVVRMLGTVIDPHYPATVLSAHGDVTLICDKAAYNG